MFDRLRREINQLREKIPCSTIWYLSNGGEFRSDLTVSELIVAGHLEIEAGGPHPILDAAAQTVRSSDGSRLHELFRTVYQKGKTNELN